MTHALWKLSLPCALHEAQALTHSQPDFADDPQVLAYSAAVLEGVGADDQSHPRSPEDEPWVIEVYTTHKPTPDLVAAVAALSASPQSPEIKAVEACDWVTISQQALPPISVGRFYIYTRFYADTKPCSLYALRIDAAQAFGTGAHETTSGCLMVLDRLCKSKRFTHILDLGTGTGILGLAAARHWRGARVVLSDIDPVALDVAREHAHANAITGLRFVVASGLHHPMLRSPHDLIIANILAGPLVAMAGEISRAVAPGGYLMLAGLLAAQEAAVFHAYHLRGFVRHDRYQKSEWPVLLLKKR